MPKFFIETSLGLVNITLDKLEPCQICNKDIIDKDDLSTLHLMVFILMPYSFLKKGINDSYFITFESQNYSYHEYRLQDYSRVTRKLAKYVLKDIAQNIVDYV